MNTQLSKALTERKEFIEKAHWFLNKTKGLCDVFASKELIGMQEKINGLEAALQSSEVKVVVIGEFSRGKSTLVNALMDIKLLVSAQQATTAVNTFVRALPEGHSDKFIRIHYLDGKYDDLKWGEDDSALEKWGTELNVENKEARANVERIEVFMSHPLLDQGLVVIDTPGLQSVMEHHEAITRKAIDEAHIAVWVQSTQQLGGNKTEWDFLKGTINKNFNKFLTVVNMWDTVIEPVDEADRNKSLADRERQNYSVVERNFKENLKGISDDSKIEKMIGRDNLIGVSSRWALDKEKRKDSNIGLLEKRFSDMLLTGEGFDEIYQKPMKSLQQDIQLPLEKMITESLNLLGDDKSIEERKRELERIEQDIKVLEVQIRKADSELETDHEKNCEYVVSKIKKSIVDPVKDFSEDVEYGIDESYIKDVLKGQKGTEIQLNLPAELRNEFEKVVEDVAQRMESIYKDIKKRLKDLREGYENDVAKAAEQINRKLKDIDFELPEFNVSLELDLSGVAEHAKASAELDDKIAKQQQEIKRLEFEMGRHSDNSSEVEAARQRLRRTERERESLGRRPEVKSIQVSREVPVWGLGWLGVTTTEVKYEKDDTAGRRWDEEQAYVKSQQQAAEARYEKLIAEERERAARRNAAEASKRMNEYEKLELERLRNERNKNTEEELKKEVKHARERLVRSTRNELSRIIKLLEKPLTASVETIFEEHCEMLRKAVQESVAQPLAAKVEERKNINKAIEEGEEAIAALKAKLEQGLSEVKELIGMTEAAIQNQRGAKA